MLSETRSLNRVELFSILSTASDKSRSIFVLVTHTLSLTWTLLCTHLFAHFRLLSRITAHFILFSDFSPLAFLKGAITAWNHQNLNVYFYNFWYLRVCSALTLLCMHISVLSLYKVCFYFFLLFFCCWSFLFLYSWVVSVLLDGWSGFNFHPYAFMRV